MHGTSDPARKRFIFQQCDAAGMLLLHTFLIHCPQDTSCHLPVGPHLITALSVLVRCFFTSMLLPVLVFVLIKQ